MFSSYLNALAAEGTYRAGAQLQATGLEAALRALKAAIDAYIDGDESNDEQAARDGAVQAAE